MHFASLHCLSLDILLQILNGLVCSARVDLSSPNSNVLCEYLAGV